MRFAYVDGITLKVDDTAFRNCIADRCVSNSTSIQFTSVAVLFDSVHDTEFS